MSEKANNKRGFPVNERTALYLIAVLALIGISSYVRLGFELRRNPAGQTVYFKCRSDQVIAPADRSRAPIRVPEEFKLNPNTATCEELMRIPSIGPVMAQRIIDYRSTVKRFDSIDELKQVKGIGNKKLEKLRIYFIIKDK